MDAGMKTAPPMGAGASFFYRRRRVLVCLVLILSSLACWGLGRRLWAELLYKGAGADLREMRPRAALFRMEKAVGLSPKEPAFWTRLGEARHLMARTEPLHEGKKRVLAAKNAFETAFSLDPLDPEAAFRLAEEAALLERISRDPGQKGEAPPGKARDLFETALRLRPGSARYHQAFTRYLGEKGDRPALAAAVAALVRVYPHAAKGLSKEPWWTPDLAGAVAGGLQAAVVSGRHGTDAEKILSAFLEQQKAPLAGETP